MADELAPRRRTRAKAPAPVVRTPRKASVARRKAPPLWLWFINQAAHTDRTKSAAVRYVMGRWSISEYSNFARIQTSLRSEDSPYFPGFFKVLTEYRETFEIDDEKFSHLTGTGVDLLPAYAEMCSQTECEREAVPGTRLCRDHGGVWITFDDQEKISAHVTQRLIGMQGRAASVLQELMDSARSEDVRLRAAQHVLAAIRGNAPITIEHTGTVEVVGGEAARIVLERLEQLAPRAQEIVDSYGDEILEAEVVEG